MRNFNKTAKLDLLVVLLALSSVLLLFFEIFSSITPQQQKLIQYADVAIALVFLAEFLYKLSTTDDKKLFLKGHWWELFAAIPITTHTTQALRAIRLERLLPLIETLRIVRFVVRVKIVLATSQKYTKQTALIFLVLGIGLIMILGALGFYHFEYGANPNVKSFGDSLYWAAVTMATVGYGDIYPITGGGRIVTVLLIFSGVGSLGAFLAIIESYILRQTKIGQE